MSDELERDATAARPDEVEAAARLASAVDGRPHPGVDPEALAAIFLLQAAALGEASDELAEARLRRRLRRLRWRRAVVRVAAGAAAAAVLIAVTLHLLPREEATAALVEQREQEARRAVTDLVASRSNDDPVRPLLLAARQHELLAAIRSDRFETLRWSVLDRSVEPTRSPQATTPPPPTPTDPGGRRS